MILNKDKIYEAFFRYFFKFPDPVKSLYMISSGKRSFSNLFNDYNVKFLPETQFIKIDFKRKKLNIKQKRSRNSFYLEYFEDEVFIITKKGSFFNVFLSFLICPFFFFNVCFFDLFLFAYNPSL